jgi:hypothetical protein
MADQPQKTTVSPTRLEKYVDAVCFMALTFYAGTNLGIDVRDTWQLSDVIPNILKLCGIGVCLQLAYVVVGVILTVVFRPAAR